MNDSSLTTEIDTDQPAVDGYWHEFQSHWKALLAATIGLSAGMSINAYVSSIFAPYLIAEFDWSKAQFVLMGALSLVTLVFMPIAGRFTDLYGVRRVARIGIVGYPLSLLLFSSMTGNIITFYCLVIVQAIFCLTTTTGIYSRVVAHEYSQSRGLALAICASGPAVVGGLASPLLTAFNDDFGWRSGYLLLALCSAIMGLITLWLLPEENRATAEPESKRQARADYRGIICNPAFGILLFGAVLCSFPHALSHSQIKVMLIEHGVTSAEAGFMVSVFAMGVLAGRFGAGIALDRWPTHIASAVFMGLPSIGLFILATDVTTLWLLAFSVALIGLSFGGEADILAYTTAKYFPLAIYSSVIGLLLAAVGLAIGLGSVILSFFLRMQDSFSLFMIVAAVAVLGGSLNLLRLSGLPACREKELASCLR